VRVVIAAVVLVAAFAGLQQAMGCAVQSNLDFGQGFLADGRALGVVDQNLVRIPLAGGTATSIAPIDIPWRSSTAFNPDGTLAVLTDQHDLGSDCLGRRSTVLFSTETGAPIHKWNASTQVLAGLDAGWVTEGPDYRLIPWETPERAHRLDFDFPEGTSIYRVAAAGNTLALFDGRSGDRFWIVDLHGTEAALRPGASEHRLPDGPSDLAAVSLTRDGRSLAVLLSDWDSTDKSTSWSLARLDLEAGPAVWTTLWTHTDQDYHWRHHNVAAMPDGWIVTLAHDAYWVPNEGPAALLFHTKGTIAGTASADALGAVFVTHEFNRLETIQLVGTNGSLGQALTAEGKDWVLSDATMAPGRPSPAVAEVLPLILLALAMALRRPIRRP